MLQKFISAKNILLSIFICLQPVLHAQNNSHGGGFTDPNLIPVDTSEVVNVVYPPLGSREGFGKLNIPIPPNEHPRLFFRKQHIPELTAKIESPLMKDCWNNILKNAATDVSGRELFIADRKRIDTKLQDQVEAKAFLYAFRNDEKMGKDAVDAVLKFKIRPVLHLGHRELGRLITTYAVVYDWCYNLISTEQKKELIQRMESLATKLEFGWPYLKQGSLVGHGSEAKLAHDMLSCAVATYNEKPEIYNLVASRIIHEFVPGRNFFYPSAYHHQGSAYGNHRFLHDVSITMIFDRMGYPNFLGTDQVKVPYRMIYTRRPDGTFMRDGDDFSELFISLGKRWPIVTAASLGSYFNDPVLMGEAIASNLVGNDLFDFILINPFTQASNNKASLPLTKYFPSPLGAIVARTSWDEGMDSKAVVADLKIGEYNYANHQHLDAGNFQIYYKGPLAVSSGIYQGTTGGYGCDHFKNYYQRSISKNSMLVFNPNEKFLWHGQEVSNDGGQLYPNGGAEPANMDSLLNGKYRTGQVLAHHIGPDSINSEFAYLKGELAQAYSSKVKSFKRSFVFLNMNNPKVPAALVVFDRVDAANKDFKKTWLLHCVEEPVIEGNVTTVKRTGKGYNGQLVNTTLLPLPENLSMAKVGGVGNEYNVNGINYPQYVAQENNSADGAIWRLEVSPKTADNINNFLNVMQVMDCNSKPMSVERIETEQFTGTKIGDRIVLFSKNSEKTHAPFSLKITGNGTFKILITDLQEGLWKVQGLKNNKGLALMVKSGENTLTFSAPAGNYKITRE